MRRRPLLLALGLTPAAVTAQRAAPTPAAAVAPLLDTAFVKVPTWRFVGPDGNRAIAVAPSDPNVV